VVSNDKLVLQIEDLAVLARDLRRHADSLESELTRLGLMWKTVDRHGWEHRADLAEHRFKRMKKDLQHSVDGLRSHANEVERRIGVLIPEQQPGPGDTGAAPPDGTPPVGTPPDPSGGGGSNPDPSAGTDGGGSPEPTGGTGGTGGAGGGESDGPGGQSSYPTYPTDSQGGATDPQATANGSIPYGQGNLSQSMSEALDSLKDEHQAVVDGMAQIKQDTVEAVNNALGDWTQEHSAELGGAAGLGGAALGGVMGTSAQGLSPGEDQGEQLATVGRDDSAVETSALDDRAPTTSSVAASTSGAITGDTTVDTSLRSTAQDAGGPTAHDMAMVGVSPDDLTAVNNGERPLGYGSNEQWQQSQGELYGALDQSGLHDASVQLQGDATGVAPDGTGTPFPKSEEQFIAQASAMGIPEDTARQLWQSSPFSSEDPSALPDQHFFDSRHTLGLDNQPSGYDFAISSDALAQQLANAGASPADGWEKFFGDLYPLLKAWAEKWTELTGRMHTFTPGGAATTSGWNLRPPGSPNP